MFCENCGNRLLEGAKFCGGCGAKTEPVQPAYTAAAEPAPPRPAPAPAYASPVRAEPPYQQAYAPPPAYASPVRAEHPSQQAYAPQQHLAYSGQPGSDPLRVGQYIGMFLLMCVPVVNIILLFVWSFGGSVNPNKKNYARASLILGAIGLILAILFGAALVSIFEELFSSMSGYY